MTDGRKFDRMNYRAFRSVAVYTKPDNNMSRLAVYTLAMTVSDAERKAEEAVPKRYTIVKTGLMGSLKSFEMLKGGEVRNAETEPAMIAKMD